MSWSSHRKLIILSIIGAAVAAIIALAVIATVYEIPSCADNTQNQDETGIDCGGSCTLLCAVDQKALNPLFTRQLIAPNGRTDVIAYVENPNPDALAKDVPYRITLYGKDNIIVSSKTGKMSVPPSTTVPVFVPGFYSGFQEVARAFLEFEGEVEWYRDEVERPKLSVSDVELDEGGTPRLTASISNPTAKPLYRVPVVATLFDSNKNAIAASATVVDVIPAQGSAPLIFTWNAPFSAPVARTEIIPILGL